MYYSRIGRHLACKMATLLALMFAACSNDTTPSTVAHDGGYTEETGLYALSGRVGDAIPMMLTVQASSDTSIHPNVTSKTLLTKKGTIVVVYELDSLTLDTTGRSFADTISKRSPFLQPPSTGWSGCRLSHA